MSLANKRQPNRLELWSPWLFVLAAVFLFVGTVNSGLTFLIDGYTFNEGHGIVLELGRLAALLGTAGLAVQIMDRNAWFGKLNLAVSSLAVVFVTVLIAMATLKATGVLAEPIGIVGIVAYVMSVSTFLVVGFGIVRTGTHTPRIGSLLLVNVVALLVVFFGRLFVPLGLVATVVPGIQILLYLSVGYTLWDRRLRTPQTASVTNTTP